MIDNTFLRLAFSLICLGSFSTNIYAQKPTVEVETAIFTAAKFQRFGSGWMSKCSLAHIIIYQDINNDGRMDAVISDGGTPCYGKTASGFYLMTTQSNGKWTPIFRSIGDPRFLTTIGRHGWPDILVKTVNACSAIYRWNGKKFEVDRRSNNSKPC